MHAILTPVGSQGDVNPFIVVGRELRRRGHRVTIVAPEVFSGVASNAGLGFASDGTVEEYERITNDPDLWHPRRGLAVALGAVTSQMQRAYGVVERVYEPGESILIGHPLSVFTRVFEEMHRAPAVTVHLAPGIFRSDFGQPAMPSGDDISAWPAWIKQALWWAVDRFVIDPRVAPALNAWRAELGLPPVSRVFKSWIHSPQRVIGLFPDWFGPPQPDWPRELRLAGFVLSDESCAPGGLPLGTSAGSSGAGSRAVGSPPASRRDGLEEFLATGDPPVVFTPGSANRQAAAFFRTAVDATALLGRRALLVTGYPEHVPAPLPAHAHHAGYAPFATLFPRAAAVVHHGGIGTVAQALAAGAPQLLMPMGFDQPDNALRTKRLGVGEAIYPQKFTAERVAAALGRLLASAEVSSACRRCRERIDGTASLRHACDLIEQHYGALQDHARPSTMH